MNYRELKEQNQQDFNAFPMGFAFSRDQLAAEMERLGVQNEADLIGIGGGGFIRKTDRAAFLELLERTQDRIQEAIDADPDGREFVADMIETELADHEYCITNDLTDTLEALGFTAEEIEQSPKLKTGLTEAVKNYRAAGYE